MLGILYLCCEFYEHSGFYVKPQERFKNSSVKQMGTFRKIIYLLTYSDKNGEKN